jgi:hypothetical protein
LSKISAGLSSLGEELESHPKTYKSAMDSDIHPSYPHPLLIGQADLASKVMEVSNERFHDKLETSIGRAGIDCYDIVCDTLR